MKQLNKLWIGLCAAGLLSLGLNAQETEAKCSRTGYALAGKHQFTLTAGALADSDYADDQAVGSFDYSYWATDCLAFTVSAGGISSDDHHCGCGDDDGVGMVLVGVQLRPEFLNITDRVFFTVQGMVGPYVGVNEWGHDWGWDDNHTHYRSNHDKDTETQWGAYLGLNLNVAVTRHFIIGASAGYHFVDEFDYPVNGETDYNSPDFRLRFSFML